MTSAKPFDLLLKNGNVLHPDQGVSGVLDIAVKDGKISKLGPDIPAEQAETVIDISGFYAVPGLIDMHCHIFQTLPINSDTLSCVDPEAHMFQNGVCTAVDAGTCGWRDFLFFKEQVIDRSNLRILAFLNIATGGMISLPTEMEKKNFFPRVVAEVAKAFPDIIPGIKTAHYKIKRPFSGDYPPWASVDSTIQAAELSGKIAMFDVWPAPPERPYEDLLLKKMRPGDIHTHVFAPHIPVIDATGKPARYMLEAREKGIIFDLGHGAGSFSFRNAVPACRNEFFPDTISTDLYRDNIAGPSFGLIHIMTKMMNLGMDFMEVLKGVTVNPAKVLGIDAGTLTPNGPADIAVLSIEDRKVAFGDCEQKRIEGGKKLECRLTIKDGVIRYNPDAMGLNSFVF